MARVTAAGDPIVSVVSVLPDAGDAVDLIQQVHRDLGRRYPGARIHGLRPDDIADPRLLFLIAYANGLAIACGALREFEPRVGQMKRMFVRPEWRGRGVARRLLAELERRAVDRGFLSYAPRDGAAAARGHRVGSVGRLHDHSVVCQI